jgi:hypothetical protein
MEVKKQDSNEHLTLRNSQSHAEERIVSWMFELSVSIKFASLEAGHTW